MAGNARVTETVPIGRSDSVKKDVAYYAECITAGCGWSYMPSDGIATKRGPGGSAYYNARVHAGTHRHHVMVYATTEYDGRTVSALSERVAPSTRDSATPPPEGRE